jgi:citrate lyase beta subunit
VPRYHFHLHEDGVVVDDEEGLALADDASARDAAVRAARDVLAGAVLDGRLPLDDFIMVTDHAGRTILTLTLGAAVSKPGR